MDKDITIYIYAILIGAIGGFIRMFKHGWKIALAELVVAGFMGFLIALICVNFKVSTELTGFLAGISGLLGKEFTINLIKNIIKEKVK